MKRWLIGLALVGLCCVLFGVFAAGFGRDVHKVPFGMKGKKAPTFSLRDLGSDRRISLEDFKGKPVIVNFWATWCGPCAMEHPVLEWGARQYGDRVQFLGMVFEDTLQNARQFLGEHGQSFPQLEDPNSLTAVKYGAAGVPETYFIDRDGTIVDKYEGPIPPDVLTAHIRELLGESKATGQTAQEAPQ
jgi:cytochrome c biogenesis protein CcmG/thiol:disulfide interchange protein DsbE